MRGLLRQIQIDLLRTREQAEIGVSIADALQRDLNADAFNDAQEWLAGRIRDTERRIRVVTDRRRRRPRLLNPRLERKPELRRILGNHHALLERREEVLGRRRAMLRSIGDTLAWLACGSEPRIVYALFDPAKTQHAPTGVGAIGHHVIRRKAHKDGRFLVVENDLTRCFGKGDLTVIPLEAPGSSRVYPVELKTKGRAEVGEQAYTHAHFMVEEGDRLDAAYVRDFAEAVGMESSVDRTASETVQRQRAEIGEARRVAWRLLSRISAGISGPPPLANAPAIRAVLNRAIQNGLGFDAPERGLGYAAIRTDSGIDSESALRRIDDFMERVRLEGGREHVIIASTASLLSVAEMSINVRPIPLWSLPHQHRTLLLSGDVLLQVRYDGLALKDALDDRGVRIRLVEAQLRWELTLPNGELIALDLVGMAELTARLMFEGVSPRDFAKQLVAELGA